MKKQRLLVLVASAMLLAACANNTPTSSAQQNVIPSNEPTSNVPSNEPASNVPSNEASSNIPSNEPSSEPAVTVSSISLDTANVQKVYLLSLMTPDKLDVVDTTGLAVTATLSDGTTQNVALDDVTIDAPELNSKGEKTVTVSYEGATATYNVKVGEYKATAAEIANVDGKAIVTVSGVYDGVTAEELKASPWSGDFQKNGYNGGTWDGAWDECANGAIVLTAADGAFSYTRDVTELDPYLYTGHFGHKKVPNNNNGVQNMDLKIMGAEEAKKSITIGSRSYELNYNVGKTEPTECWGNLSLTVKDASAPVWNLSELKVVSAENKAYISLKIAFENYSEEAFRAIAFGIDLEANGNYSNGWAGIQKSEFELGSKWTIANGVASFQLEVTDLVEGGYTMHFGIGKNGDKAPDYKPSEFTNTDVTVGDYKYSLVCWPNIGNDGLKFWGCVGLIVENVASKAEIATSTISGTEKATLTLAGTGKGLAADLFKADLELNNVWSKIDLTTSVNINEGNWTLTADIPADAPKGTHLVHWFFNDKKHDLEKKDDLQADFAPSSTVIGSVSYELKIVELWNRQMICLVISDVA